MPRDSRDFFGTVMDGAVIRVRDRQAAEAASRPVVTPKTAVEKTIDANVERHRRELVEQRAREDAQFVEQNRRRQDQIDREAAAKALDEKRAKFHLQEESLEFLYRLHDATDEERATVNNRAVEAGHFGDLSYHLNSLQALRWSRG